jgi:hypothetical protein
MSDFDGLISVVKSFALGVRLRDVSVARDEYPDPLSRTHETTKPSWLTHVVWVVGPGDCVRHRKEPKSFDSCVVIVNGLDDFIPTSSCSVCSTYVGTKQVSCIAKPFDGSYGLGLEHCNAP